MAMLRRPIEKLELFLFQVEVPQFPKQVIPQQHSPVRTQ